MTVICGLMEFEKIYWTNITTRRDEQNSYSMCSANGGGEV